MAPSQAAQNLREWAKQIAEAKNWYLPFYRGRSVYGVLAEILNVPNDDALVRLNDCDISTLISNSPEALDNFILWLCFLADVIETDGTDWIQNA